MLEAYSKSVTIPANSSAPFTNVSLTKGDTSEMQGDATILFNKCGVNYNMALNTASINQNTTAQVQKVLDAIAESKIDTLQQKVNELQLREAMNGVVRYPNQFAYNAGSNPFCGCGGCGC